MVECALCSCREMRPLFDANGRHPYMLEVRGNIDRGSRSRTRGRYNGERLLRMQRQGYNMSDKSNVKDLKRGRGLQTLVRSL